MRLLALILMIVVVAAGAAFTFPEVRDEAHWLGARLGGATAAAEYLDSRPDGRHAADAARRIDDLDWADVQQTASWEGAAAYERYLASHPSGAHAAEARDRIEETEWTAARIFVSTESVQAFLDRHPAGRYAAEASSLVEELRWDEALADGSPTALRNHVAQHPARAVEAEPLIAAALADDAPFDAALRSGDAQAISSFLDGYPGHARETQARAALVDAEGRDVFDLIEEGKLEVSIDGAGIDSVRLTVRNRAPHGLNARVEPGTFFVSDSDYAQDMVAVSRREFRLEVDAEIDIYIDAACAAQHAAVPEGGDGFTMRRAPPNDDLARLAPLLDQVDPPYKVKQAAVWIVTDDSDYYGLGDLISGGGGGFGGSRLINEPEAAQAMKLIADAGVDLRERLIWQDRETIAAGLPMEDPNRAWLLSL